MKKILLTLICLSTLLSSCTQDALNNILKNPVLSDADITAGLKSALSVGTDSGTTFLHRPNGYLLNPDTSIRIPLPPDAQKVITIISSIPGLDGIVTNVITSMNRAAEDAAIEAQPIFLNAITSITITDASTILRGGDSLAATKYLQNKTDTQLIALFKPKIKVSLDKVSATQYWGTLASTYNAIPFVTPITTDLPTYVTQRAILGLFKMVGKQERLIRRDPLQRVTDILKKVFGSI